MAHESAYQSFIHTYHFLFYAYCVDYVKLTGRMIRNHYRRLLSLFKYFLCTYCVNYHKSSQSFIITSLNLQMLDLFLPLLVRLAGRQVMLPLSHNSRTSKPLPSLRSANHLKNPLTSSTSTDCTPALIITAKVATLSSSSQQ